MSVSSTAKPCNVLYGWAYFCPRTGSLVTTETAIFLGYRGVRGLLTMWIPCFLRPKSAPVYPVTSLPSWRCIPSVSGRDNLTLLLSGDIDVNPGPMQHDVNTAPRPTSVFPCGHCELAVNWSDDAICCDLCSIWCHQSCCDSVQKPGRWVMEMLPLPHTQHLTHMRSVILLGSIQFTAHTMHGRGLHQTRHSHPPAPSYHCSTVPLRPQVTPCHPLPPIPPVPLDHKPWHYNQQRTRPSPPSTQEQ